MTELSQSTELGASQLTNSIIDLNLNFRFLFEIFQPFKRKRMWNLFLGGGERGRKVLWRGRGIDAI